jgi:hypothetical protein
VREVIAMKRTLLACAVAAALGGCYKSTIHLADNPGTPGAVNEAMHISIIGLFELSPVDLKAACPGGASTIREKVSVIGGIINLFVEPIVYIYNPSVDCGGGGEAPAAPAGGEAPAAPPAE